MTKPHSNVSGKAVSETDIAKQTTTLDAASWDKLQAAISNPKPPAEALKALLSENE